MSSIPSYWAFPLWPDCPFRDEVVGDWVDIRLGEGLLGPTVVFHRGHDWLAVKASQFAGDDRAAALAAVNARIASWPAAQAPLVASSVD